jgi:hypothetical protein
MVSPRCKQFGPSGLTVPTGFVFSPDLQYIAVVADDGCLRIIDALNERHVNSFAVMFLL